MEPLEYVSRRFFQASSRGFIVCLDRTRCISALFPCTLQRTASRLFTPFPLVFLHICCFLFARRLVPSPPLCLDLYASKRERQMRDRQRKDRDTSAMSRDGAKRKTNTTETIVYCAPAERWRSCNDCTAISPSTTSYLYCAFLPRHRC